MGLGCGMSMVKYLLFVFNLICAIGGIAIITIGSIVLSNISDLSEIFAEHSIQWAPITTIIVGSIIFLIAFFGCCGAIRESYCMMMIYASILMVLAIGKVIIGVYILVNVDEFRTGVVNTYNNIWTNGQSNPDGNPLGILQQAMQCCGNTGPENFGTPLPNSCCNVNVLTNGACLTGDNFTRGCKVTLTNLVDDSADLIAAIVLAVAGIELLGFIFACCLASSIRSNSRR